MNGSLFATHLSTANSAKGFLETTWLLYTYYIDYLPSICCLNILTSGEYGRLDPSTPRPSCILWHEMFAVRGTKAIVQERAFPAGCWGPLAHVVSSKVRRIMNIVFGVHLEWVGFNVDELCICTRQRRSFSLVCWTSISSREGAYCMNLSQCHVHEGRNQSQLTTLNSAQRAQWEYPVPKTATQLQLVAWWQTPYPCVWTQMLHIKLSTPYLLYRAVKCGRLVQNTEPS